MIFGPSLSSWYSIICLTRLLLLYATSMYRRHNKRNKKCELDSCICRSKKSKLRYACLFFMRHRYETNVAKNNACLTSALRSADNSRVPDTRVSRLIRLLLSFVEKASCRHLLVNDEGEIREHFASITTSTITLWLDAPWRKWPKCTSRSALCSYLEHSLYTYFASSKRKLCNGEKYFWNKKCLKTWIWDFWA